MFFNKLFSSSPTTNTTSNTSKTDDNNGVETVLTNLETQQDHTPTTETETANGGLFSNTFKKFGSTLSNKETYKKFGSTISVFTNNVIQKIDDERKKLIEEANNAKNLNSNQQQNLLLPPWLDFKVEPFDKQKEILDKLLDIKMSRKTFLTPPPIDADYCQEFDSFLIQIAKISLQSDPTLEKIRFYLVPSKISEEQFWKNWYYRITLIKKHYNLPVYSNLKDLISYQEQLLNDHKSGNSSPTNSISDIGAGKPTEKDVNLSPNSTEIEKWEKELQSELESFNINDLSLNFNESLDDDWNKINMELESNTDVISTPTVLQIDSDELITSNNDSDIEMELEKELLKIKELDEINNPKNNNNNNSSDDEDAIAKANQEELIKEIENELSQFQKEEEEEQQLQSSKN